VKNMSEHTNLSWRDGCHHPVTGPTTANVSGPTCGGKNWGYGQVVRGYETLAICPDSDCGGRPVPHSGDARAAFIVRACNSHEALVKALEQAVSYFGAPTDGWSGIRDDDTLQLTVNVRAGDLKSMIAALHLSREGDSNG